MASIVSIDNVQLINLVQQNPCLWDRNNAGYRKNTTVAVTWEEIAKKMGAPVGPVKTKWRGLRDTFRKEYKKSQNASETVVSKWPHFKTASFLQNTYSPNIQYIPKAKKSLHKNYNNLSVSTDLISKEAATFETISQLLETDKKKLEQLKLLMETNNDEEYGEDSRFLMSLLTHMHRIPINRKMIVKAKLYQILIAEEVSCSLSNCVKT